VFNSTQSFAEKIDFVKNVHTARVVGHLVFLPKNSLVVLTSFHSSATACKIKFTKKLHKIVPLETKGPAKGFAEILKTAGHKKSNVVQKNELIHLR